MPRRPTGKADAREHADGRTVTWHLRFRAYGRRERLVLGTNLEGWNRDRAEIELERILQLVERGTWASPRDQPKAEPPGREETFRTFIDRWWDAKRHRLDESTVLDYEWRLGYLHRYFDRFPLSAITVAEVDRFRDQLVKQAEVIHAAAERGKSMLEDVTDKDGRTYRRRRRPLSNTSINAMLTLLGQVLERAVEYELLARNPVRVGERLLPRVRPERSFLEVDEFHDLLAAAGELDAESDRPDRRLGRRAMLATLGLTGLRIGELTELRRGDVDFAHGRLKIRDAKTPAGVREVEMTLYLRSELVRYSAERERLGFPLAPSDYMFGTFRGGRRDPDRFRDRILARSVEGANTKRTLAGKPAIAGRITPHSLRRTWATFAATVGREPKWIAAQIGHRSPSLTFSVYQQVATRRSVDAVAIWELMRFADEPLERGSSRQVTRGQDPLFGPGNGPTADDELWAELDAAEEDR